jgi:hypothetical protein
VGELTGCPPSTPQQTARPSAARHRARRPIRPRRPAPVSASAESSAGKIVWSTSPQRKASATANIPGRSCALSTIFSGSRHDAFPTCAVDSAPSGARYRPPDPGPRPLANAQCYRSPRRRGPARLFRPKARSGRVVRLTVHAASTSTRLARMSPCGRGGWAVCCGPTGLGIHARARSRQGHRRPASAPARQPLRRREPHRFGARSPAQKSTHPRGETAHRRSRRRHRPCRCRGRRRCRGPRRARSRSTGGVRSTRPRLRSWWPPSLPTGNAATSPGGNERRRPVFVGPLFAHCDRELTLVLRPLRASWKLTPTRSLPMPKRRAAGDLSFTHVLLR